MSTIVVDSSSIITCALNCLLWVYDEFKEKGVKFVVPDDVRREVVESGIHSQKFRFEALRVVHHFENGTFEVIYKDVKRLSEEILKLANSSFYIKNNPLKILQKADAEVMALAKEINANAILTDERTLRMLIENPKGIKKHLEHKFHTKVKVKEGNLKKLSEIVANVPVLRSVELLAIALESDIFDPTFERSKKAGFDKKDVISGVLLASKFSGCSVSFDEINTYVNLILKGKK